jgi:hypothetical protein
MDPEEQMAQMVDAAFVIPEWPGSPICNDTVRYLLTRGGLVRTAVRIVRENTVSGVEEGLPERESRIQALSKVAGRSVNLLVAVCSEECWYEELAVVLVALATP